MRQVGDSVPKRVVIGAQAKQLTRELVMNASRMARFRRKSAGSAASFRSRQPVLQR